MIHAKLKLTEVTVDAGIRLVGDIGAVRAMGSSHLLVASAVVSVRVHAGVDFVGDLGVVGAGIVGMSVGGMRAGGGGSLAVDRSGGVGGYRLMLLVG